MMNWIREQQKIYLEKPREELLNGEAFDFLMKNGEIRVFKGMLQMWDGSAYVDLMPWTKVEDMGMKLTGKENMMIRNQGSFRTMMSPAVGGSIENCTKKIAVSILFKNKQL
jgi:hypothetical protein